jgi:hypothetical protein
LEPACSAELSSLYWWLPVTLNLSVVEPSAPAKVMVPTEVDPSPQSMTAL